MVLCNMNGRRRHHDIIYAVPKLAGPLRLNISLRQFNHSCKIFCQRFLVETNVNISNELNFSDVHRSVNYIGSLVQFT